MTPAESVAQIKRVTEIVDLIRRHHRRRRHGMKLQQKIDRSTESFVRVNFSKWSPDLPEAEREKINKEVLAIIKQVRAGKCDDEDICWVVRGSDRSREHADAMREESEKIMIGLAEQLPVFPWIESIRGAGALGLATIVAEAGDLSNYPNVAKLWKRLGFAPYDGAAGSTWKRESWRTRTLTKEEWIDNPFSGQRYALIHQVAVWLVNAQWIGKAKTADGEGRPNGPYGEVYAERRAHTMITHPDWTDGHRRMDALRVAMKAFLKDLHIEWHEQARRAAAAAEAKPKAKPKRLAPRRQLALPKPKRVKEAAE